MQKAPIEAISASIKEMITKEVINKFDIEINFDVPDAEFVSKIGSKPVINIYLYDLIENYELRYSDSLTTLITVNDGNGDEPSPTLTSNIRYRPTFVNLSFLITAWSRSQNNKSIVEQQILSNIVSGIGKFECIPINILLNNDFNPTPYGVPIQILGQSKLHSIGEFWNSLGTPPKPTIHLAVIAPINVHQIVKVPTIAGTSSATSADNAPFEKGQPHSITIIGTVNITSDITYQDIEVTLKKSDSGLEIKSKLNENCNFFYIDLDEGNYIAWAINVIDNNKGDEKQITLTKTPEGTIKTESLSLSI
ncbi:Pvc16 family protein [Spartinivicinus poritis]|uniref:Pvc16 family protein n=1 Tax=Spartinivicinus poritis TaxID=2994640 RepID=A0ABT5ULZ9_9GAMM|nr:Pvc16 family protein [Spartinivicinus sp. A2-2]MDE1466049.1 Pvc16 family protein [Spartinivicinus sp. A2-2]